MGTCLANARPRARGIAVRRRCLIPLSAVPRARRPAGYARWAFDEEAEAECWFAEPALSGRDGAAVEYWAVSTGRDGTVETIAGVALLRFGADGRVVAERDYWNLAEGRVDPYPGWGPVRA
jgi:hypothetical protein